jgi:hypothetical protein
MWTFFRAPSNLSIWRRDLNARRDVERQKFGMPRVIDEYLCLWTHAGRLWTLQKAFSAVFAIFTATNDSLFALFLSLSLVFEKFVRIMLEHWLPLLLLLYVFHYSFSLLT